MSKSYPDWRTAQRCKRAAAKGGMLDLGPSQGLMVSYQCNFPAIEVKLKSFNTKNYG